MIDTLYAGFVPLVDAAVLIVARELGFAHEHDIDLQLVRQPSWALLRDHLNLGHLQCAQALAPLPIASRLGLGQVKSRMAVPFVLGRGGNAITVTNSLADAMRATGLVGQAGGPAAWGAALSQVLATRPEPLTFAMVYPFSGHNFELRYWLAAAGLDPDADVRIVSLPPALMADSMAAGYIDGFCVGEPWNSVAVDSAIGEIILTKSEIFPHGIEKVLAVPEALLTDTGPISRLMMGLSSAAEWCDDPRNHDRLAGLLGQEEYLDMAPSLIIRALRGSLTSSAGQKDFLCFHRGHANRPSQNEALWLYAQMVRWGLAKPGDGDDRIARSVFRRSFYDNVMGFGTDEPEPPVLACDDVVFDGAAIGEYLNQFPVPLSG